LKGHRKKKGGKQTAERRVERKETDREEKWMGRGRGSEAEERQKGRGRVLRQ
jgi:hypothetical protein